MVSSPTDATDSLTKTKPDVTAPTDRITQQAQAGAENLSATSPFRAGKDTTTSISTDTQVKSASEQMSMGAGIGTTGKTESFQTSDGSTIQGQIYTSKDGTFMKVAGGDDGKGTTYQIEQGENGQRNLSKIDSDGNKEPVQLKQQNDTGNSNRPAEATPTPQQVDRAAQVPPQAPDVSLEKAPTVDKAPPVEKAPTSSSPEAALGSATKSSPPESPIALSTEKQATPPADAPPTPQHDQSFAPSGHTDTQSPQVHNDTQVGWQPDRVGNNGFDRLGNPGGSGIDHPGHDQPAPPPNLSNPSGRVDQTLPPTVQRSEPPSPPHAEGATDTSVVSQAGHPISLAPSPGDAAPAAPVAPAAPAQIIRFTGGPGGIDGGTRDFTGGRDTEKHVTPTNDSTVTPTVPSQPPQTYQKASPVDTTAGASTYHPEAPAAPAAPASPASPPPFATPPAAQGARGDLDGASRPFDGTSFRPPADGTSFRPPADGTSFRPPADGTSFRPPADGTSFRPPADGTSFRPPADGTNFRPPADGTNFRPPADGTSFRPPTDGQGYKPPVDYQKTPGNDGSPSPLPARNSDTGAPTLETTGSQRVSNPDINVNARTWTDAGSMTGLKPPGTDAVTIASRSGADTSALNAAMVAASKPGPGDALAKVSAPIEVFAPTAAQNRMLQQAGFNGNNPADAAFLASARAQLLSAHNDGSATLAAALNGANQANLNKLAALLTGKSDATANNVVLNEANIARLNALFKPEAGAMQPGMAMSLDAKNAAALGLANVLAGRQPALTQMTQREVYGELNKLGSQLITGQTVAIGELISRNLIRPTDLVAGAGLLAHKLEPLEIKPTTGSLNANPENALSVANAIAAARARALDVNGEITSGKSNAYAPHGDHVDGLSLLPGKGLVIEGKRPEGSADASIGPNGKPIATAGAEAMLNTKAAADAARANATKNIEGEHPAGAELTLGTRKDMAEPGDTVDPKKKPDGKGDNQGISIDGSLLTGAALRLFGDKKDEKKDETKASSKVDETRSQRRKYLVKEGDTLDSIAQKAFGESKMSVLIAAVNSEVIAQDTDPHAPLQLGLSIWLPSEIEVEDFVGNVNDQLTDAADQKLTAEEELTRRFGNGWDGSKKPTAEAAEPQADLITAAAAALAASTKRRENVERLLGPLSEKKIDYITYTVRLGDTLKSVATKHPALKDVALWELVASVNEITVPENNASAVKLARGSKLKLPTAAEIEEFRNANPSKKPIGSGPNSGPRTGGATGARSIVFPPGNPLANALTDKQDANAVDEHAVTRASAPIRDAGASLLRAGGFVKTHDDATIVTSPLEKLPRPEISKPITTDKPSVENIKNLSEDCRVVRRHQVDATGRLYQAQLEVLKAGVWTSVMMYNISDGNCWRKSINELGITEVLQLDLPTAAIHQMLESDFANNWQEYRDRTLSTANAY